MSESKPKTKPSSVVVSSTKKRGMLGLLRHWYVALIILLIIAGVIIALVATSNNNHKVAISNACSSRPNVINQAATALSPAANYKLPPIALKIMVLPKYQNDPNCLYIVTAFYLNVGNAANAQKYLTKFNKLYDGHNLNPSLSKAKSVSSLRSAVAELKSKPNTANFIGIP